ncbi:MAG: response regulator [Bacteroidota bacterium]
MKTNILIIDDEPQIRKILKLTLEAQEYKITEAGNASEGIIFAGTSQPGVIILDLGLPDQDGFEVLKEIRSYSQTPVIVLSVRNSEDDIVAALDLGADDYMTKPFNTSELLARIRACLRKSQPPKENIFVNGKLRIDYSSHLVYCNDQEIRLTGTEYSLLLLFVRNIGKVLTHRYILREIWGPSYVEHPQYLRVFVGQLRKKIGDELNESRMIVTESGVGYRMMQVKQ